MNFPPPVLVFKTAHPYASHSNIRERVHLPGASKLLVTFDSNCQISADMLTRLTFYRDDQYQDAIATFAGRRGHGQWESFIVPGDRFWFKFTSGSLFAPTRHVADCVTGG